MKKILSILLCLLIIPSVCLGAYVHDTNDVTTVATSNSSPYTITASAELSVDYAAWKAFDHVANSGTDRGWFSGTVATGSITIDMGSGNGKYFTSAKLNI